MMKIFLPLLCVLSLSCKSPRNDAEVKEFESSDRSDKQALVVIAGGFGSCPDDFIFDKAMRAGKTEQMYQMFLSKGLPALIHQKTGSVPAVFSVCYTGPDNLASNLTQSISGRYAWNNGNLGKKAVAVTRFGIPQSAALTSANFLAGMKHELQDYINSQKADGKTVDLFLIGHSYGGFTSIQLADTFSENLTGLFTIDPISMMNCQAHDMATKVFSTLTMKHPGCLQAPGDPYSLKSIGNIQAAISNSSGKKWWYHTYQNAFPLLRSGPIVGVTGNNPENKLFTINSFNSIFTDGDYHSQMGRNEALWQTVVDRISRMP